MRLSRAVQGIANQLMGHLRRAVPFIGGLGLGLYVTRVVAEATRVAWSLPGLLILAIVTVSASLILARFIARKTQRGSTAGIQPRQHISFTDLIAIINIYLFHLATAAEG